MPKTCDATRVNAFGHCSTDRVLVWHGAPTPALGCGRHATYDPQAVARGHAAREETTAPVPA